MCGRYALIWRPSQVRAYLEDEDLPVDDAPEDDGPGAPRQSYNFAPGYHGIVYRANVPDWGAGSRSRKSDEEHPEEPASDDVEESEGEVGYKLQSMKWGLIPFWTKRNPDYGNVMKTINCRDDSLAASGGMWNTMKQKKRCIVICQGFYEWLKKNGGKEKVPHFIKRKDGGPMLMAGLWDCVRYEGEEDKQYTYTIITTDSNAQLKFLHDRMPVIFDHDSEAVRTWLDPKRSTWSKELQSLLKPFQGELECYPVSKDVGKVGNNSPNFIIPVASSENKANIANFFAKGAAKETRKDDREEESGQAKSIMETSDVKSEISKKEEEGEMSVKVKHEEGEDRKTIDHEGTEDNAPLPVPRDEIKKGVKRELNLDDVPDEEPPKKVLNTSTSPMKTSTPQKSTRKTRSATSNDTASPGKTPMKDKGSQKITSFFKK